MAEHGTAHDRAAIVALNDDFGYFLDHGELESFLALFTEDVDYRNGPRHLAGRAAMRAFFTARAGGGRVSRHFYSGLRISFDAPDRARSVSVWLTFAGSGTPPIRPAEPFAVGDITDEYRKEDGVWRFAARRISQVFLSGTVPELPADARK